MERTGKGWAMNGTAPEDAPSFRPQLFRLGAVLNGLETGATAMHKRLVQVMSAVQSGTYKIDPIQLSRRIIGDTLRRCPENS